MDSLSLWLALAPSQVEELRSRRRVPADITFSRIDLSSSEAPVGRPSDVHQCYEYSFWEFKILKLEITALGYFRKMEAGILEKVSPGEFRWYGTMLPEERDEKGQLLYRLIEPRRPPILLLNVTVLRTECFVVV